MSTQPPYRTRFYKDRANGKFLGVCSGIADYAGIDVTLIRIMFVASLLMSGGITLPLYIATRSRMRAIDRRLADVEYYVTTENRSLAREIEQLR